MSTEEKKGININSKELIEKFKIFNEKSHQNLKQIVVL